MAIENKAEKVGSYLDERTQDYEDKLILMITSRLKRYRVFKLLLYVIALPLLLPLILLVTLGEWAETLLNLLQKGLYEIRFQVVWRLRWNELSRKRHAEKKKV